MLPRKGAAPVGGLRDETLYYTVKRMKTLPHSAAPSALMRGLGVTVLSGFVGAGKTSVVNHILRNAQGRRISIVTSAPQDDVLEQVSRVAVEPEIDYLLLESSGVSDPMSVAAALTAYGSDAANFAGAVRVDTMVTVIDTTALLDLFCSWSTLADHAAGLDPSDSRLVVDVVAEQVEFADVVVLNKIDRVSQRTVQSVAKLVRALNPGARLIESQYGCVLPREIVDARRFDFERTRRMAGWAQAFAGTHGAQPAAEGISSFIYRSRRPFHPQRFMSFIKGAWPGVVRSRGHFWLATRMAWIGEMVQAGGARRHRAVGAWWASTLGGRSVDPQLMAQTLGVPWDAAFGDRRQELVFVGIDMREAALRQQLNGCLLSDEELSRGPESWQAYADPFPPWDLPLPARGTASLN
jgi:G3E family GTPase